MNFVPTNNILIVARFGLKLFGTLYSSTGTIWFSNMLRGQIEISKASVLPEDALKDPQFLFLPWIEPLLKFPL